jgi:hypothetical protein
MIEDLDHWYWVTAVDVVANGLLQLEGPHPEVVADIQVAAVVVMDSL